MSKRTILVLTDAQRHIINMALKGWTEEGSPDTGAKIRTLNAIDRQLAGDLTRAELLNAAENIACRLRAKPNPTQENTHG